MTWTIHHPTLGQIATLATSNSNNNVIIVDLYDTVIVVEVPFNVFCAQVHKWGYNVNYINNTITTLEEPISDEFPDFDYIFSEDDWYVIDTIPNEDDYEEDDVELSFKDKIIIIVQNFTAFVRDALSILV